VGASSIEPKFGFISSSPLTLFLQLNMLEKQDKRIVTTVLGVVFGNEGLAVKTKNGLALMELN
jgi:hypothetical protein